VYYRIYSSNGSIQVKNPEFPDDPWLGRTLVHRITPPHTVTRIKDHLARLEAINDLANTQLFANVSCPAPLQDTEFINTRDLDGFGATPEDPLALVVPGSSTSSAAALPSGGRPGSVVIYRLRTLRDRTSSCASHCQDIPDRVLSHQTSRSGQRSVFHHGRDSPHQWCHTQP
jgi:hypothetical protein